MGASELQAGRDHEELPRGLTGPTKEALRLLEEHGFPVGTYGAGRKHTGMATRQTPDDADSVISGGRDAAAGEEDAEGVELKGSNFPPLETLRISAGHEGGDSPVVTPASPGGAWASGSPFAERGADEG